MSTYCWARVCVESWTKNCQKDAIAYMKLRNSELKAAGNEYLPFNKIVIKKDCEDFRFESQGNGGIQEDELEKLAKHLKSLGHGFTLEGFAWAEMDCVPTFDSREM